MKDIKKAALWGGLVAAGTVVALAGYAYYLGKKTDTNKKTLEFVYPKLEEPKKDDVESASVEVKDNEK